MERKSRKIVQFISFISLFFVGLVLLLESLMGPNSFMNFLKIIAGFLVLIILIVNAFFYIRTKRSNVFMLLFVIGTLFLIIAFILPFVL